MMLRKSPAYLLILFLIMISPVSSFGYDIPFNETTYMEFKGDLTYTAKVRTEDPDPELAKESKGNSNFEKWDMMNNKGIVRLEMKLDSTYLTLFGKGEAFYDYVMDDDEMYPEGTDTDEAKKYAARRLDPQEYYLDFHMEQFTLRAGRQIVEWGESIAPVYAPGVGVINIIDGSRIGAAGYTPRDYKVPGLMAWSSWEIVRGFSIEGVYAPDFDPRYAIPVVGTSFSFMDVGGFGSPKQLVDPATGTATAYEDRRPTEFKDMQQYGGAIRKVFPSFGNLEWGLYYFHYFDWGPYMNIEGDSLAEMKAVATYQDMDMYGTSICAAIDAFGLDFQVNGELAYRPNEPAQLYGVKRIYVGTMPLDIDGAPIGFERVRTLNWGIGGSKIISDFLSFTPWIVSFQPMFECYGGNNLDYHKDDRIYAKPEHTAYYMVSLQLDSSDLIDNTRLFLTIMGTGTLHKEQRSLHAIGATLEAKIGDSLGIKLGYDYKMGKPEEASMSPNNMPDRDAAMASLTWYLI